MQRLALCFVLGLVLLTGAFTGCARDPEPKYVMPDVPYVDPAELKLGMAGGVPPPKEAKENVPSGKSKEKPATKEAKKEKQDETEKGKADK